jgi:short-subunit dehydrogenase/uncharacterized protein (DUF2141 family)
MSLSAAYRDRVVLISGAGMGIGKELARQVWASGGMVIALGRNAGRLDDAANSICGVAASEGRKRFLTIAGDVAIPGDCQRVVEMGLQHFGRIDYLIHNAAVFHFDRIDAASEQVIDQMIDVNLKGCIHLTRAALPALRDTRGGILFVSSISAFYGMPEYGLYALSKAALTPLSESLRLENHANGVFVGITYLGYVANESEKRAMDSSGIPQPLPERPLKFTRSRESAARGMLRQLARRQPVAVPSFLGHINWLFSYLLPQVAFAIHKRSYHPKAFLWAILYISLHFPFLLRAQERVHELVVQVEGVRTTGNSMLMAGVFDEASFPHGKPLYSNQLKVSGTRMRWSVPVPEANYAVAVYQDLNGNGRLDKSTVGFPLEPYGFSRNYRPVYRGPRWRDASIAVERDLSILIRLIEP